MGSSLGNLIAGTSDSEKKASATVVGAYAFFAATQVSKENLGLADSGSRDPIDSFLKTSLGFASSNGRSAISTIGTLDFGSDAGTTSSELNFARGQTTFADLGIVNDRQSYQIGYQYGVNERNELNLERAAIEIERERVLRGDTLRTSLNETNDYYADRQYNASNGVSAAGYAVLGAGAKSAYNLGIAARGVYRLVFDSETKILAANTLVKLVNHPVEATRATLLTGYKFSQLPLGEQSSALGQFGLDFALGSGVAKGLGLIGSIAEKAAANTSSFYRSIPNDFGQFSVANGASAGVDFSSLRPLNFFTECFVAGTLVHTEGGAKPIETIIVGDKVAARNEHTGETSWRAVKQLFTIEDKIILNVTLRSPAGDLETISATNEHPFFVNEERWRAAKDLAPCDRIVLLDGGCAEVVSVEVAPTRATAYNFEVADVHTYFVGSMGVWVHNSSSINWVDVKGANSAAQSPFKLGTIFEDAGVARATSEAFESGQVTRRLSVRAFDDSGQLLPGRTQLDAAGIRLDTGEFGALEFKLSDNAPFTTRQLEHFPFLQKNGGVVVGNNGQAIGLPAGSVLEPFGVYKVTGPKLPAPGNWWDHIYE